MKKFKVRNLLKPYFLIPLILIVLVGCAFLFWRLMPQKTVSIAIVDKTVPATAADNFSYLNDVSNNYRKHIGLNWLLDYMKIENPDTGKGYDAQRDYYGPKLDDNNEIVETNSIANITGIPDLLYLADTYGVEIQEDHGLTAEEMNTVSLCHSSGSVIIGEQDILSTATSDNVASQLEKLFGMKTTGWVGRYIFDLQDMTDVPYWAPDMWEQKYGQEWKLSGPGILLVSNKGDILVLEEKTDFESKNLLKIAIEKEYRHQFGKRSMNYYNWFELIEADYGTEVLATYSFNVNATGAEKLATVSNTTTFAAVTRKTDEGSAPAYYFAGDFNDYVTKKQISCFCFADTFFRLFSFDREGDVTNFYWNFYEPVMKIIMKDMIKNLNVMDQVPNVQVAQVTQEGSFQVKVNGAWQDLEIKGFRINGEMPGCEPNEYSRDYDSYVSLIASAAEMGANCIGTYDLLPPEFYRALYENNKKSDTPIYLIEGIMTPTDIAPQDSLSMLELIKQNIDDTLLAVHGGGTVPGAGKRQEMSYSYNVAPYVIAYLIDPRIDGTVSDAWMTGDNSDFTFEGTYLSSTENCVQAFAAALCDYTLTKQGEAYGCLNPVSICFGAERLAGAQWTRETTNTYNLSHLTVLSEAKGLYFSSYALNTSDSALRNTPNFADYTDASGSFAYGGYLSEVKALCPGPVLIERVGLSTNSNLFEAERQINGLSEKAQGEGLVRILKNVSNQGYLGALIADLNDNWSALSDEMAPYTLPTSNNGLWQNTADRAQTTGVVAADAILPTEVNMELNDSGAMSQMQLSTNETYIYMTIVLSGEINYDEQELIIGIDSYQRNNGEYFYDQGYYANALSGMEYIIKFESKQAASLYVSKSYNRNTGNFASQESYNAAYDLETVLNYGDFSTSNTHFYVTGMTIHLRIPWAMLNFTDPSSRLVINGYDGNAVRTMATEGMIFSLLIGEKQTKDTAYIFPKNKQQAGYKTFKLSGWDATTVKYTLREKASVAILKRYFGAN